MATSVSLRRAVGALLTSLLTLGITLALAAPAQGDEGYRYWNYFHVSGGAFEFAKTGAADFTPEDGAIEGWRYGTSTESAGIEPRADLTKLTFDSVCTGTEAGSGEKRVAVLVDYGIEADSPDGEVPPPVAHCAVVPQQADGQQTLESVAELRMESGGVCALDGYPAKGCFETLNDVEVDADQPTVAFALPEAATAAAPDDDPTSGAATSPAGEESGTSVGWPLVAVLVLLVVLAAVAVPLYRRNRDS